MWKLACLRTHWLRIFFLIDTEPGSQQIKKENEEEPDQFPQTYVRTGTGQFSQKCKNCPTLVVTLFLLEINKNTITLKISNTQYQDLGSDLTNTT
jgi:hypothetical protein